MISLKSVENFHEGKNWSWNFYLLVNKCYCWGFLWVVFSKCQAKPENKKVWSVKSPNAHYSHQLNYLVWFGTWKANGSILHLNVPSSKGVPVGPNITADLRRTGNQSQLVADSAFRCPPMDSWAVKNDDSTDMRNIDHWNILFSAGAPLIPSGGLFCIFRKSLSNRLSAILDIFLLKSCKGTHF